MKTFPALMDPDEIKDFGIIWNLLLPGETIITSEWFVDVGDVTISNPGILNNTTIIWVSGGTPGTESILRNTITTSNNPPHVYDRSGKLNVQEL